VADQPYRWECVTDNAPFAPRDGAGALAFAGRMWLLGGWNPRDKEHFPNICNNEVWSSEDGRTWTLERANTFGTDRFDPDTDWEGRHTAGYAVLRGRMWIVGGDANQKHYQPDVWSSADGVSWTRANPDRPVPWGPRALHHAVSFRDRLWVMGGQTMPGFAPAEERFYADVWASSDGARWECVQPAPLWPGRGMIGGSAVLGGRMFLLGGGTYDTPQTRMRLLYNDVWSSADGVHWQRVLERAPWAPRQYHEVAVWDDKLWVLEGFAGGENRNDVWFSPDGGTWTELEDTPWPPRHAASVFVHRDALWMVAGNNMTSDVWRLTRAGHG